MAITVLERWQGRGASTDERGIRTLKREWAVSTDTDATGEPAVITAVIAFDASAALYASHPNWAPALCRSITADPNGSGRQWLVRAQYSSAAFEARGDGSGSGSNSASPTAAAAGNDTQADQRPPTLSITRKEVTEPLEFDAVTAARVVNLVGDPFDPPPEVFRSRHLLTWKFCRTPAQLDWATRSLFMDSVNESAVTVLGRTYPAKSLRCADYSITSVWDTGAAGLAFFWECTVQAEYHPDTWEFELLNTGRRKLLTLPVVGDVAVSIVDEHGQPASDPVPLDAAGQPVAPGGTFAYVAFNGYPVLEWLGAGSSLTGAGGLLA